MRLIVLPADKLQGRVSLPASKSYSVRAFIVAACGGMSTVISPSDCDDAKVALAVAKRLGAKITRLASDRWRIEAHFTQKKSGIINVGESGTVLRFLLPLLPFFQESAKVTGQGTLFGRPNHHLTTLLRSRGLDIRGEGEEESIPIHFRGGTIKGGTMTIDGSLSSQFISALLIACPRLDEDVLLKIKGRQIVSQEYITMTRQVLAKAGIRVTAVDERTYRISGHQRFKGLKNFVVPSDYGLAAFLMAAGILIKSDITLAGNLSRAFVQADGKILDFLQKMGGRFKRTDLAITLRGPQILRGGKFSLKDSPDLVPVMAVLALFAQGKTELVDIRHARAKESDRISDLRQELLKVGAHVVEKANSLTIFPQPQYTSHVVLDPHHDHRLAMAFCVLGLRLGLSVKDIECVSKSYPGFVRDIKKLGARKLN